MSPNDAIIDIMHQLGRIEANMAELRTEVAYLRDAAARRATWWGGSASGWMSAIVALLAVGIAAFR